MTALFPSLVAPEKRTRTAAPKAPAGLQDLQDATGHGVVLHLPGGTVRVQGRDARGWVAVRATSSGKELGGEVVVPSENPFMAAFVRFLGRA